MKEDRSFRQNDCPHPWLVLSATSLGAVLTAINGSILTTALPVVVRHFNARPMASSWSLLSYMFPVTILIVSFGRSADPFGRARLYIGGLAVVTASAFPLGLAPSLGALLALRALQAIGAGLILANAVTPITDAFSTDRLGEALGVNTMIVSVGQLLGPVLGGSVAATWGLALGGLGLVAILAALRPATACAWMVPGLVVAGAGFGLFIAPNTSVIMLSIPPQRRGVASGIRWTLQTGRR